MAPTTAERKRVNFMIDMGVLKELESLIPSGERSDFVNEAIEEKILDWGRRKGIELLRTSIKKEKHIHTTKEILQVIHADRKN